MKSFSERSPHLIGVVLVALIVAGTTAALLLTAGVFKNQYSVIGEFADAAGVGSGAKVRVAGVHVGDVGSVNQRDGIVEIELKVNSGVELTADTRAAIVVETLLGQKYVRLTTGDDWSDLLAGGDRITDTDTPVEFLDLQNIGAPLAEQADGEALDQLLESLTSVTEGSRDDVATLIDGLNRITGVVNDREQEARRLIDSAAVLTRTLADRDDELLTAVDNLNIVVGDLAARRTELEQLLRSTAAAAAETADLIEVNRPQLDEILDEVHATLQIVGRHQVDLAHSVAYLGAGIEGFASIGYSGPDDFPNRWANLFTQLVGATGPDALFGSCGLLDDVLDLVLGPDPLACEDRTGEFNTDAATATTSSAAGGADLTYQGLLGGDR